MPQKTILISGAGGNLGAACVRYFLDRNYAVAGVVHNSQAEPPNTTNYKEFTADLLDEQAAKAALSDAASHFGNINTAVLTAGGFNAGNIEKTSLKDIEKMWRLNFVTAYNLARPLLARMKKQGHGKIIFIGSLPGMNTRKGKGVAAYALSKSLLFQLANIINAETTGTEVQALVIVPGTIDTPQNRAAVPDADFSTWEKPEEIAAVIAKYNALKSTEISSTEIIIREELKR